MNNWFIYIYLSFLKYNNPITFECKTQEQLYDLVGECMMHIVRSKLKIPASYIFGE